jgi:hypothetical protein
LQYAELTTEPDEGSKLLLKAFQKAGGRAATEPDATYDTRRFHFVW